MVTHDATAHSLDNIIFLIHPGCYEVLPPERVRRDDLSMFVETERVVTERWLDTLRSRPSRTLFAQLGGPQYLTDAACEQLGADYTLRFTTPFPESGSLHEYYEGLSAEFMTHMDSHGLKLDLAGVRSELWGESFEGCVPGYGGAFAQYLSLRHAPSMRFEMTVHDSRFLYGHRRHEVIPIAGTDIEVWLFECHDGTGAAMFQARRHAQWIDSRRISLRLDDRRVQVCTKLGHTVWPAEPWHKGKEERVIEFTLEVSECIWRWIRSAGMPMEEFKDVVGRAVLGEPVLSLEREST